MGSRGGCGHLEGVVTCWIVCKADYRPLSVGVVDDVMVDSRPRGSDVGGQGISRMVLCAMAACGNRSTRDKSKSYFRLPKVVTHQGDKTFELSKRRRDEWLARIRREDITPKQHPDIRVCSDHFVGGPAKLYDVVSPDWAPSLNLGYNSFHSTSISMERYKRISKRNSRKRSRVDDGADVIVNRSEVVDDNEGDTWRRI